MNTTTHRSLVLATVGCLASVTASAQSVLFTDSFEADSSADYTFGNDGSVDGVQDFGYDYVAAGIPLAPRSPEGDTGALRLTVNTSAGAPDAITCFNNTAVTADRYTVTVDVWMNFSGTVATTEHAHLGVGGDGLTFNQLFSPISGSGAFIGFDGDGGTGSSDYRWYRDPANTPIGDPDSTTLPNSHPSYLGNGSDNDDPFFQALFPAPPASVLGSPGNVWTTVTIFVDNPSGQIFFSFGDALTFRGEFAGRLDGFVSLGLGDLFASIGNADSFTLYDNLEVTSGFATNYCGAAVNSTGLAGQMSVTGSPIVTENDVTLMATQVPMDSFGYFLVSPGQDFFANPAGSTGNLCLAAPIGRLSGPGQIQNSGSSGEFSLAIDLTGIPVSGGVIFVQPNVITTLNFQAWFRDSNPAGSTSNFTDGIEVTFR